MPVTSLYTANIQFNIDKKGLGQELQDVKAILKDMFKDQSKGESLVDAGEAVKSFQEIKKQTVDLNKELKDLRPQVAEVDKAFRSIPIKNAEGVNLLKLQLNDLRGFALATTRRIEALSDLINSGRLNEKQKLAATENLQLLGEQATLTSKRLTEVENTAKDLGSEGFDRTKQQVKELREITDVNVRGMLTRYRDLRDGVALAFQGSGSAIIGFRTAIFGITDTNNILAKSLDVMDKWKGRWDDWRDDTPRFTAASKRLSESMASQSFQVSEQVKALTKLAQADGVAASSTASLSTGIKDLSNLYSSMTTTIASGRAPTTRTLEAIEQKANLVELAFENLATQPGISDATLQQLNKARDILTNSSLATRQMSKQMEILVEEQKEEKAAAKKSQAAIRSLGSEFKSTSKAASNLTIELEKNSQALEFILGFASKFAGGALANILFGGGGGLPGVGGGGGGFGFIQAANDIEASSKRIQASLRLTSEEARISGDIITAVYTNNFGGSINEVGEQVQQTIGRLRRVGATNCRRNTERKSIFVCFERRLGS